MEKCPECKTETVFRFTDFIVWCSKCDKEFIIPNNKRVFPYKGELELLKR